MADKKTMTLFNYIGGKTWLKEHLKKEVEFILSQKKLTHYVEPFAGGLGAFLGVYDTLLNHGVKNIILNDINAKLINFYTIVRDNPEALIKQYHTLETAFNITIPEQSKLLHKTRDKVILKTLLKPCEENYKQVRDNFNQQQSPELSAASLLFLQNHCFNGVYRENSKGGYNTPFNWEAKLYTEEKIREKVLSVHNLFKQFNIQFSNVSFEEMNFNDYSLYYLDPPYINEVEALENQYHKDSFNVEKQKQLIKKISKSSFIYSNHDNELLLKEFQTYSLNTQIKKIARKNIISASNESRKTDKLEILVSSVN